MQTIRKSVATFAMLALAGGAMAQSYPEREISGVIQWSAGGATDVVSRAITPHVEEIIGKKIVMQNKPGGVGAIATNFVYQQSADGYTLLYGAENPQLHAVMGIANLDYSKFYPINILGRGKVVVIANNDKPWKSFRELLDDIEANPGKIKMGTAGPGSVPHTVSAMITAVAKLPVTAVPFDGDGPGLTALQGGHIDFMASSLGSAAEHIKAGRMRVLAVLSDTAMTDSALGNIPPITDALPGVAKYLPWGPFYGVFAKRDIPEEAKAKLSAAFRKAAQSPQFIELMNGRHNEIVNLSGEEADAFLKKWQSVTAWILQGAGLAKHSPAEFGIPKP